MFGNAWRLGRIGGIEIRIDTSWVVIALLVTYSLYLRFTLSFPHLAAAVAVILAVVSAFLFFGSVLTHEMAHALVARRRGIKVQGITLFLFGGATHAKVESRGPKDEFAISVVGPLTSLVLAGIFFAVGTLGRGVLPDPVAGGFRYLGLVNLLLAVFNLLPGFPLDGGRVLRSLVWRASGSLTRATRVASVVGQVVGYLMVATGAAFVFAGGLIGGIWLAAIGWFLAQAARSSLEQLQVQRVLESVDAEDLMAAELVTIPPTLSIREAVDGYFMRHDHGAFPVEDQGHTLGLLTLRGVKRVPQEEWPSRRVDQVMEPIGEQCTVEATSRMDRVVAKLQEGRTGRCLVLRDGEVVGIITPSDIARWLGRRRALQA